MPYPDNDANAIAKARRQASRPGAHKASPERLARIRELQSIPRVRVEPVNDELRHLLRHPSTNMGFRTSGSVEWPYDQFTVRRIKDGSVRVVEQEAPAPAPESAPVAVKRGRPAQPESPSVVEG